MPHNHTRRRVIRIAVLPALALPAVLLAREAAAQTNPALREQLKYQDTPMKDQACTACLEFLPGKTEADRGACKVIPGDDEIAPNGWCTAWNTL